MNSERSSLAVGRTNVRAECIELRTTGAPPIVTEVDTTATQIWSIIAVFASSVLVVELTFDEMRWVRISTVRSCFQARPIP